MGLTKIMESQFLAGLAMLEESLTLCPGEVWDDPSHKNRFWHIGYHALHYTNLYLSDSLAAFIPWVGQRENYHYLGRLPTPPHDEPKIDEPYDKATLLDYLAYCRARMTIALPKTDFDAPSGFPWLPMDKLELQIYNARHLQHHTGQLADRLRCAGIGLRWVGLVHTPQG